MGKSYIDLDCDWLEKSLKLIVVFCFYWGIIRGFFCGLFSCCTLLGLSGLGLSGGCNPPLRYCGGIYGKNETKGKRAHRKKSYRLHKGSCMARVRLRYGSIGGGFNKGY